MSQHSINSPKTVSRLSIDSHSFKCMQCQLAKLYFCLGKLEAQNCRAKFRKLESKKLYQTESQSLNIIVPRGLSYICCNCTLFTIIISIYTEVILCFLIEACINNASFITKILHILTG